MPYNTRRISLSLPSLGVHLPGSNSSRAHNKSQNSARDIAPPPKRIKRSHTLGSISSTSSLSTTPPHLHSRASSTSAPRPAGPAAEHTPPPSPPGFRSTKLDTTGINDDIVVAVLRQLEKTGNRPHLIKELVAILINTLSVVERSVTVTTSSFVPRMANLLLQLRQSCCHYLFTADELFKTAMDCPGAMSACQRTNHHPPT